MVKLSYIIFVLALTSVLWGVNSAWSQNNLLSTTTDSIGLDYRSGGVNLDSIDASFIGTLNLRPGSGDLRLIEFDLPVAFGDQLNGLSYRMNEFRVQPKWTGLPYLGFQYAFGSRLNQAMNLEFHQYFKPNTHLHFRYYRRTSNGFLRNSDFVLNDVSLLFVHSKNKFSTELKAYYGADEQGENEGVIGDSLIPVFPLEFIGVQNESGRSQVRLLDVEWTNYFRALGDSTLGSGFMSNHNYDLRGRQYTSSIVDPSIFDTLFIDTLETRDQYQTASISNGAGVYFNSPKISAEAALNHRYWRNQNRGVNVDTNEAFLDANVILRINNSTKLKSYFYANFLGALGELKSHNSLTFRTSKKFQLQGSLNFENSYPDPYLRNHVANYYAWSIPQGQLELQQMLSVSGVMKYGKKNHVVSKLNWTSVNNGRYFIDGDWRQDTLDLISMGSIGFQAQFKFGGWAFYPGVTLRFQSNNFNYQPSFSTLNRISYSTKVFSNNLGVAIGADLGYDSGYSFLNYNGVLGVMSPFSGTLDATALVRINAFAALSVDEFRFFVRAENIDYFINDPISRVGESVPLMPFLIRIGLTWDFFN
jgi:hypothetical protein